MVTTWILLLFTPNFFWYKTKLFKATFIPHIRAVGPIKKLEALEVRLLAHIGRLKKICIKKMKRFDIFQEKVNFPSIYRLGSYCYSLETFLSVNQSYEVRVSFHLTFARRVPPNSGGT